MVFKSSLLQTGSGGGVTSLNTLTGGLALTSTGATITITPSGTAINLESAGGAVNANAYSLIGNTTNTTGAATSVQYPILGTPGYSTSGVNLLQATINANNFTQVSLQNTNSGSAASADFVVTADTGNDTVNYADFGINNSSGGATPFINPLAAYLYTVTPELDIGAVNASGVINFHTGATPTQYLSLNQNGVLAAANGGSIQATDFLAGSNLDSYIIAMSAAL